MFYYVNGTVAELEAGLAVIDCGGVGYACATTNYTLSQLKKGERAKLYTYLNVREDAMELFGFASQSELRSFKMLIGVSGVGPKAALSILSSTTPQQLAMAVVMGDEKALPAAPGITSAITKSHSALFRASSHFQLRISGRSTPLSRIYWRCSTSLSCIFCTR